MVLPTARLAAPQRQHKLVPSRLEPVGGLVAVLGAWTIVASLVFVPTTAATLGFASALGFVALGVVGLTAHELTTERVVHSLEVEESEGARRPLADRQPVAASPQEKEGRRLASALFTGRIPTWSPAGPTPPVPANMPAPPPPPPAATSKGEPRSALVLTPEAPPPPPPALPPDPVQPRTAVMFNRT